MKLMIVGLISVLATLSASAAERTANSVEASDGTIKCITASNGWITSSTGPCKGFVAPRRIAKGEVFEIEGKKLTIGFIGVNVFEKDMRSYGSVRPFKAGDITCTAATSQSQVPSGTDGHSGSWMYVDRCRPVD